MDFLNQYQILIYLIGSFLSITVLIPFLLYELKKKRESKKLINRIIPVSSLFPADLEKIESCHHSGKKMHPFINNSLCVGCGSCVINCKEKGALYLVDGKSTLVNPFTCRGWGDCSEACPTGANQLVEYGMPMKIKLPEIDDSFETNIPGIHIIGSLTGAGLIKEAINQGRAVINHIMKDVYPDNLPKILIVGAGPAGLSAFLSCRKFGLPVVCIEKEETANTIRNFPKKKILMAEPVEIPIYGPLWIGDTTREKLLVVWEKLLEKTGVIIETAAKMERVTVENKRFKVIVSEKEHLYDKIILAVGTRGEPRKLDVPGEELPHVFYNLLDAAEYSGADIIVVGAGDSAIEASLALKSQGCRVSLVVRGTEFSKAKTKNVEKIENALKEKTLNVFFSSTVREIKISAVDLHTPMGIKQIKSDHVFIMIGGVMPFQFLESLGIRIVEKNLKN